mmetsp:Transcript_62803/g.183665  ORF Transcript_62803/g.183665 Transcript_62803/m.183665 type:complete len:631 (-) Transcript_62803:98-1990(-)
MSISRSSTSDVSGGSPKNLTNHQLAEKLTSLFGEFKGLRAQFTEFRKQIVSQSEMKTMREEMKSMRQECAAVRDSGAVLRQCQQAMEQHSAMQVAIQQQLESMAPGARAAVGMQQELQRVQAQADSLSQQVRGMQADQAGGSQSLRQETQALKQEQTMLRRKSEEAGQQVQRLQQLSQELAQKLQAFEGSQSQALEAKREVERLRQEHGSMKQKCEDAVSKLQAVSQQTQEALRSVDQTKSETQRSLTQLKQELSSVKNESQGAKGHQREQQAHMRRLEEKTRGLDEIGRLKATMDTTGAEFWILKKQLYDSGVLAPKKDPEPEKTPVGTLELGEDVFTARLLIRLGLMKGAADAAKEARELKGNDEDEWSDAGSSEGGTLLGNGGLVEGFEEDVTGLAVPEIEPGGKGYMLATAGWVAICVATLCVQVMIVGIMLLYGVESGDECITPPVSTGRWYMLHVSKAAATLAAGMFMGKELMDIVNYWMVSELLETRHSPEVICSAVLRIALILFIAAANVIIFATMTSPADVWINMTALGFIGELSTAMLDIAKRGVFGHHIGKTVTSVNYSLNFMTDYPWWFAYARGVALTVAGVFITFFAVILYLMPDNICLADGSSEVDNLFERVVGWR